MEPNQPLLLQKGKDEDEGKEPQNQKDLDVLHSCQHHPFLWVGPSIEAGPLPGICYFALSAKESLTLDPYNQPSQFLLSSFPEKIRIFSLSLPSHGEGLNPVYAIEDWAKQMNGGNDLLSPFFSFLIEGLHQLFASGLIEENRLGLMGLSRGAFIALHTAAQMPHITHILGFAPLTDLSHTKEFRSFSLPSSFSLFSHLDTLASKTIRFYIGNRDTRVGTKRCFTLVEALVEERYKHSRQPVPIELLITPSIGHMGHGTSTQVFEAGANWLARQLTL